jgi:hypothetical protein
MTLRRWFAIVAGAALVFAILAAIARPLRIHVDLRLAFVVFGLAVAWSLFLVTDIRWTPNRMALFAGAIYAIVVALMMITPIDGDEPYYLLTTESIAHDGDLDLSNQYRDIAHSAAQRPDMRPQIGDTRGPHGEQYSHLEPFLSLLMVPGYLVGQLPGALMTIVIFGALLARSTVRLFEDEGIDDVTIRSLFPLIALGPPIIFYAARIWPEVPAAFFFVEAIRGMRQQRPSRWLPALGGFVLLKFRFLLVAVVLLARALRDWRHIAIAIAVVAVVLPIGMATTGHTWHEVNPGPPLWMFYGFFGLLLDGAAGILFQAPLYAFGVLAAARWRSTPAAFRLGLSSSVLYLVYLLPRPEWHGGWSPPLRYIVFLMPILALGVASIWRRLAAGPQLAVIAWTFAVTAHGLAYPWRLFHIANGENVAGETLSAIWHSDFSRMFPSYIRPNMACVVAAVLAVVAFAVFRSGRSVMPATIAAIIAIAFVFGRKPGDRIDFEDAHVIHQGGELYPYEFQVQRFLYRGGWIVHAGDSLSFLARRGPSVLQYSAGAPAMIQLGPDAYLLRPTRGYGSIRVNVGRGGRVELRCLSGAANLDRMDHE